MIVALIIIGYFVTVTIFLGLFKAAGKENKYREIDKKVD